MEKNRKLFGQRLSTEQMFWLCLANGAAPLAAVLLSNGICRLLKAGTEKLPVMLAVGMILGGAVFLLDFFLILVPLDRLKKQVQGWSDLKGEAPLPVEHADSEIGQIFSEIMIHHQQQMSREYKIEVLKRQAELMALQSQINPHFLYNTLDSIRGVALVHDVPQIAQMTEALSKLFRCMIANEGKMVSLKDEIQSVENYMLIQQFRFDGRISYQMNLDDEELLSCHVPNLIIQPIVENSVIHGLECREGGGTVSLSGYATQNRLVILVEDNGLGIPQDKLDRLNEELFHAYSLQTLGAEKEKHRGIALLNISQRIKLHYGNDYGVSIMSTPNVSTIVEITLPAIRNPRGGAA